MRYGTSRLLVVVMVLAVPAAGLGPGVAMAGYEDNEPGVHASAIDALAQLGIFDGTECGDNLFCPRKPILRWEMAVWLTRILAKNQEQQSEPVRTPSSVSRFVDVSADSWWIPHVEHLADLGVTRGCASEPARFCPFDPVTRAQMASFLSRAFGLASSDEGDVFVDVEGNTHAKNISALAAWGITKGCAVDPARFCPHKATTRAQMATFLKRAWTIFIGPCPAESSTENGNGGGGGPEV